VKLLRKVESRRLGSQSGASEVKQHKWFSKTNWGLLRNEKPPIIPVIRNAADAVNFRNIRESLSLDLENQDLCHSTPSSVPPTPGGRATGESGQWPGPAALPKTAGSPSRHEHLFVGFSSVTLHHDGELS